MHASRRLRRALSVGVASVTLLAAGLLVAAPAAADDEGPIDKASAALRTAAKNYTDAKNKLDAATKQRTALAGQITTTQRQVDALTGVVGKIAAAAYRNGNVTGGMNLFNVSIGATSPDTFLEMADTVTYLGTQNGRQIQRLRDARKKLDTQTGQLDAAIKTQKQQVDALAKKKADAEKALEAVGGTPADGFGDGTVNAAPAPRNADGSWPSESCSLKDPTNPDGCVSPRMLHAYQEVRKAGFTNYTHCSRFDSGAQDHALGKACDFSVTADGFGDEATGAAKDYGNRLAAWLVANADRLAVSYVIWFRQIWLPGAGWGAYSGSGSPSAEHTNHVHLSVQ
jgi:hypothetical protein